MEPTAPKTISVVSPCFNEEGNVRTCFETVARIFREMLPGYRLEHIFVDNCSTDRTPSTLICSAPIETTGDAVSTSDDFRREPVISTRSRVACAKAGALVRPAAPPSASARTS